jgi:hypothetical protein
MLRHSISAILLLGLLSLVVPIASGCRPAHKESTPEEKKEIEDLMIKGAKRAAELPPD